MHFGPGFLFFHGDSYRTFQPPLGGAMAWIMAPLLVLGALAVLREWRGGVHAAAARVIAACVLTYPMGDVFAAYDGVHALRSAVGMPALVLLGAFGAESAWRALEPSRAWVRRAIGGLALVAALVSFGAPARAFFGDWPQRPEVYHGFEADLSEACAWLRPRLQPNDRIVCTSTALNSPWAVLAVQLHASPRAWSTEPKSRAVSPEGWEYYERVGEWRFLYPGETPARRQLEALQSDGVPEHAWLILRPGEMGASQPSHVITRPDGTPVLWVCEVDL